MAKCPAAAKLALFKDIRAVKVRILMGSTQKMGPGTNVQERLTQAQDEIVRALDLTRNQASKELDAAAASEGDEAVAGKAAKAVRRRTSRSHAVNAQ